MLNLYDEEPDCDNCLPEIQPENKRAWEVFSLVYDQHIMGFSGPAALNMVACFKVMDCLDIENRIDCVIKVKKAYGAFINSIKAVK